MTPIRCAPTAGAPIDTFCFHGERLLVFETNAGYAWCQSQFDSYVGYVEARHLAIGSVAVPTHIVATMGSHRYAEPDLRSAVIDLLPRHSRVAVVEDGIETRGTEYAALATGGFLPSACLSPEPPRSCDLVGAVERYLGCPYLWGGKSFFGIDCSGLVQSAFRDLGVTVLRDTDMQRDTIGVVAAASSVAELCRDDLIYIPGHVLIYAGDGAVIHADGGTMMVHRDDLTALMRDRGLDFTQFTVRRAATGTSS